MFVEVQKIWFLGFNIKVVRGFNFLLDVWCGVFIFVLELFEKYLFIKVDYEERGFEWLWYYNVKYLVGSSFRQGGMLDRYFLGCGGMLDFGYWMEVVSFLLFFKKFMRGFFFWEVSNEN